MARSIMEVTIIENNTKYSDLSTKQAEDDKVATYASH